MELKHNTKEKGTFHSARWQKDYSPDLYILTRKSMTDSTSATKTVLEKIQIPIVRSIPNPGGILN